MQRQALYACGTCLEQTNQLAGVCLACSLVCHDGHTLYELYTKRNFCCDCGNSLFSESSKCHLFPVCEQYTVPQLQCRVYNVLLVRALAFLCAPLGEVPDK